MHKQDQGGTSAENTGGTTSHSVADQTIENGDVVTSFPCQGFIPQLPPPFYEGMVCAGLEKIGIIFCGSCLKSKHCSTVCNTQGGSCKTCADLAFNTSLKKIIERGSLPHDTIGLRNCDMSLAQCRAKLKEVQHEKVAVKKKLLNAHKRLQTRDQGISDHKRLLAALCENNIPRVHKLMARLIREGASVPSITQHVVDAAKGLIKIKSYDSDEDDFAWFIKRIGGQGLLAAANAMGLCGSERHLRRLGQQPRMQVCPDEPTEDCIRFNTRNLCGRGFVENIQKGGPTLVVLRMDEVKTIQGVAWDVHTDTAVGLVSAEGDRLSRSFKTYAEAEGLQKAYKDGRLKIATDGWVFAVGVHSKLHYRAVPILVLGFEKTLFTARRQYSTITTVVQTLNADPEWGLKLGSVSIIATDGDPQQRQAIDTYMCKKLSLADGDLFVLLRNLPLLDLFVGPNDETVDFDKKHCCKRLRGVMTSFTRSIKIGPTTINRRLLQLFLSASHVAEKEINSLMDVVDKQNVLKAFLMLTKIAQYDYAKLETSTLPGAQSLLVAQPSLKVLSFVCDMLVTTEINVQLTLSQQLSRLSGLAHMMFALHYEHKADCFPTVLTHDIVASVNGVFVSVAKAQILCAKTGQDMEFFLSCCGTDFLEVVFGILRTLTHNRSFDQLMLVQQIVGACHIREIADKHPTWMKQKARLAALSREWDHLSPRVWEGCCKVNGVNLDVCWEVGRGMCVKVLNKVEGFRHVSDMWFLQLAREGVTLLRPDGKTTYGVTSLGRDLLEEADTQENLDVMDYTDKLGNGHVEADADSNEFFDFFRCVACNVERKAMECSVVYF